MGQVGQHVNVWHASQHADPADQELALGRLDDCQVLPQLGDEGIDVEVGAGRDDVLRGRGQGKAQSDPGVAAASSAKVPPAAILLEASGSIVCKDGPLHS